MRTSTGVMITRNHCRMMAYQGGQSMAVLVAGHRERPGAGATVRGVHSAQRQRT